MYNLIFQEAGYDNFEWTEDTYGDKTVQFILFSWE